MPGDPRDYPTGRGPTDRPGTEYSLYQRCIAGGIRPVVAKQMAREASVICWRSIDAREAGKGSPAEVAGHTSTNPRRFRVPFDWEK